MLDSSAGRESKETRPRRSFRRINLDSRLAATVGSRRSSHRQPGSAPGGSWWRMPFVINGRMRGHPLIWTAVPSASLYSHLEGQNIIIDYLALASFGLPRGFLNMLSAVLGIDEDSSKRPTRRSAAKAVEVHADIVLNIFGVLGKQLPRYRHFIDIGFQLERSIAETLRKYNKGKPVGRQKTTVIGIQDPIPPELDKILGMAEYAGLLRRDGTVSRGVKGVFKKYTLHYAVVLKENSLSLGKSFSLDDAVASLSSTSAHAFARSRDSSLLDSNYAQKCILDLDPCRRCQTARPAHEDARFCMKCGTEFPNESVYEELLRAPIDNLPLTPKRVKNIKRDSAIRTVQDILMDEDASEIKRVQYVGPVWAARIRAAAEEYVSI
jgi:hypothetical protein